MGEKVSRKRKTVHRKEKMPSISPAPAKHACKGCGAPFPLLDALAQQYGVNWLGENILCGGCQKPQQINVNVTIDPKPIIDAVQASQVNAAKPFLDVLTKIQSQIKEFKEITSEVEVDDIRIESNDSIVERLTGSKSGVVGTREWKYPRNTNLETGKKLHENVRVETAPMEFAHVKKISWWTRLWGGKDATS
jgi:hypothetical protein